MEAFELRLWDGRLGRWLSVDPYGQYHSPYLGMGNNPGNGVDVDGGFFVPGIILGAAIGGLVSIGSQMLTKGEVDWTTVGVDTISGAFIGSGVGAVAAAAITITGSLADAAINNYQDGKKSLLTTNDLVNTAINFTFGKYGGRYIGNYLSKTKGLLGNSYNTAGFYLNKLNSSLIDNTHKFIKTKILNTRNYRRPTEYYNKKYGSYLSDGQVSFTVTSAFNSFGVDKIIAPYMPNFSIISNAGYNPGGDFHKWFREFQSFRNGRYGWVEPGTLTYGQWEE
jgi:hypothetical protein